MWLITIRHTPIVQYLKGLRGQGVPDVTNHQNGFYVVFLRGGVRSTSYFLQYQKMLIISEVIELLLVEGQCLCVIHTIFIHSYL